MPFEDIFEGALNAAEIKVVFLKTAPLNETHPSREPFSMETMGQNLAPGASSLLSKTTMYHRCGTCSLQSSRQ